MRDHCWRLFSAIFLRVSSDKAFPLRATDIFSRASMDFGARNLSKIAAFSESDFS